MLDNDDVEISEEEAGCADCKDYDDCIGYENISPDDLRCKNHKESKV